MCNNNVSEPPLFDEHEIYCIARLLQSAWFQNDMFFGCCNFCKYGAPCLGEDRTDERMYPLMEKLGRLSGLDLSRHYDQLNPKEKFSYDANAETENRRPKY